MLCCWGVEQAVSATLNPSKINFFISFPYIAKYFAFLTAYFAINS
ncbi:hypothetical protein COI_0121 [Mannheimia haemolytica serotype A2 str. OVINE]|nr:hypothetical protein COI_0121 [Mannheimia haemolytica serotype A2 str. OVINE]EEY11842.1 hypothetical protein COK_2060 [Mannheimia haemolytica serotype A2 str. BOVINE]